MVTISDTGGKRICSYMRQTCGFHGFKDILGDFPRGTVDRNLPANVGDMGLIPGLGRFHKPQSNSPCVPQLLSLHSRARELQLPSLCAATTEAHAVRARAPQLEKPGYHSEEQPPLAVTRESLRAVTKTWCNQK